MELNRAQLLVCNDRALEKFKATHSILANVTIGHPRPNDIPHIAAKMPDRISIRIWLIHQAGLRFPINPMLKKPQTRLVTVSPDKDMFLNEFVWVSGYWEFRPRDDGLWSFPRHNESLPDRFNDKFKFRSDDCKESIHAANNRQKSRDVKALLEYELYYRYRIPCRTTDFIRASLPPLQIKGELYNVRPSILRCPTARKVTSQAHLVVALQITSMRRGGRSFRSTCFEQEDDLVHALHLFVRGTEAVRTSSSEAGIMRFRNLKRAASAAIPSPKLFFLPPTPPATMSLVEEVVMTTGVDLSCLGASAPRKRKGKEPLVGFDEELAGDAAVQSLQRAMAITDRMEEYSTELKRAKKKMEQGRDANKAKLALADVSQLKADLVLAEQARDANYASVVQAQGKAAAVKVALAELQLPVCGLMYERFFTRGANRAWDNYNSFDEEKFLNRPEKDEVAPELVLDFFTAPDIEAADPTEEVRRAVAEAPAEWSTEETSADDGEDAD
ncbi:hypothetical protein Acr_00g0080500 [Actinidia rufa]|uniref:Uncharacterized protein n=1 Tax=Actinidia rufa TaxID=165716 RepID=A0A7J0DU26_9ERIC|nr:hypothetical protein Acr_00g0080500 [Actinidia rufa]